MFRTDRSVILHYCCLATRAPSSGSWLGLRGATPRIQSRNAVSRCHSVQCRKRRTVASDVRYLSVVINWSSIHVTPAQLSQGGGRLVCATTLNLSRHNQAPIILTDQDARCGSVIDQIFSDICQVRAGCDGGALYALRS
ncbi:hypothetical protein EVAR_23746_1 [Eumeta japonica]|uniref:Uncharacterized protein n=1 Tax=Eumeta variegata TaxID=151549 RepID=A0A4C1VHD4_EUMVA|nr:hypothetical protein EVAR_23746_1 [Eumeta japonica]